MTENNENEVKSTLVSRNVTVMGRRTSVRLEPEMWAALKEISRRERCKIHDICSLIMLRKNPNTSLTAAIRVFLMLYYRAAATNEGHRSAGHGNFENMVRRARVTEEVLKEGRKPLENVERAEKHVDYVRTTAIAATSIASGAASMLGS